MIYSLQFPSYLCKYVSLLFQLLGEIFLTAGKCFSICWIGLLEQPRLYLTNILKVDLFINSLKFATPC